MIQLVIRNTKEVIMQQQINNTFYSFIIILDELKQMNLFHDIFLALSKNIIAYHKQLKRYYKY